VLLFVGGARLTKTKAFNRIALSDTQDAKSGYTVSSFQKDLLGKQGKAQTILRPSGKVLIEGEIYDAFTRGDFIEKDETIEVIGTEGVTLRVKRV
jgi:membrane-bound serine protease (ClpP class)